MNHPLLYHNSNNVQRYDSEELLKEFHEKFKQLSSTSELLDIGCGDGYVTAKILNKYISGDIHVTAIDKAESMIDFAVHNFYDSNVQFEVMNIIDKPKEIFQSRFDFITSFYCLHWVKNHRILFENIHTVMKPGGRCLFIYPISHAIYDAHKILKNHPVWSGVLETSDGSMPVLQESEDPAADNIKKLIQAGFKNIKLEVRVKDFLYAGEEDFKNFVMSVNPYIDKIQGPKKEAHIEYLMELLLSLPTVTKHFNVNQQKEYINTRYSVVVGYMEK